MLRPALLVLLAAACLVFACTEPTTADPDDDVVVSPTPTACVDEDSDRACADVDCDDNDNFVSPLLTERPCDGVDNDCDPATVDEEDRDGDGFSTCEDDCNDQASSIYPGAPEVADGLDNDCDGEIDNDTTATDDDGDGFSEAQGDCDDSNPLIAPGRLDVCNALDDDCDGMLDEDAKAGWPLMTADQVGFRFMEIDTTNASTSLISNMSPQTNICSLDVQEGGLSIGASGGNGFLYLVDACSGTISTIGSTGGIVTCGIGFGPSGRLYGLDSANDNLVEFDLNTGAGTVVGPLGFDLGNNGLAYDCTTQTLWGLDARLDRIFTLDVNTGAAQNFVNITGADFNLVGLEFDHATRTLLGSRGGSMYRIEPTTGAATLIGNFSIGSVNDLGYHPPCP